MLKFSAGNGRPGTLHTTQVRRDILEVQEIERHPDYTVNLETSAYLQNDIAVFKVDDSQFSEVFI